MTRLVTAVLRVLRENWTDDAGHFHAGAVGRTYPCFDPNCAQRRDR